MAINHFYQLIQNYSERLKQTLGGLVYETINSYENQVFKSHVKKYKPDRLHQEGPWGWVSRWVKATESDIHRWSGHQPKTDAAKKTCFEFLTTASVQELHQIAPALELVNSLPALKMFIRAFEKSWDLRKSVLDGRAYALSLWGVREIADQPHSEIRRQMEVILKQCKPMLMEQLCTYLQKQGVNESSFQDTESLMNQLRGIDQECCNLIFNLGFAFSQGFGEVDGPMTQRLQNPKRLEWVNHWVGTLEKMPNLGLKILAHLEVGEDHRDLSGTAHALLEKRVLSQSVGSPKMEKSLSGHSQITGEPDQGGDQSAAVKQEGQPAPKNARPQRL